MNTVRVRCRNFPTGRLFFKAIFTYLSQMGTWPLLSSALLDKAQVTWGGNWAGWAAHEPKVYSHGLYVTLAIFASYRRAGKTNKPSAVELEKEQQRQRTAAEHGGERMQIQKAAKCPFFLLLLLVAIQEVWQNCLAHLDLCPPPQNHLISSVLYIHQNVSWL